MAKGKSKRFVIYAILGLGILFIVWPLLKGFVGGSSQPEQPGWF